jgi:hypothetical protein
MEPERTVIDGEEAVVLWRPCGPREMELVAESGFRAWPPRLPEQPIFYPVTNEQYAREVNRWNLNEQGHGFITRFLVRREFMDRYAVETVGGRRHTEWWIPAEDLAEMNANILGLIEVVDEERRA